jgi:DNA-binding beta-propeller fold protein YncE
MNSFEADGSAPFRPDQSRFRVTTPSARRAAWVAVTALVVIGGSLFAVKRGHLSVREGIVSCTSPVPAPGGRVLVANQASGSASLLNVASGEVRHIALGGEPHGVAVSPDGRWGVVADYGKRKQTNAPPGGNFDGNRLSVLDMANAQLIRTIETGEHRGLHDMAFAPGSSRRLYVTAQRSREVLEIDILDSAIVRAMNAHGDGSHTLAVSPDGTRLITANEESDDLSEIDLTTGSSLRRFAVPASPLGLSYLPNGSELLVGEQGGLRFVDVATFAVRDSISGIPFPDDIAVTNDGNTAVVSAGDDGVLLIDMAARRIRGTLMFTAHASAVASDNRTAFVTMGKEHQLAVIDLQKGCVIKRVAVQRTPDKVAWAR